MKALKVFIAEDEVLVLNNFINKVKKMGHQIVGQALDGLAAEEGIRRLHPDIVLMDIDMPKRNGVSVIKNVCEEEMIPSIIVTGNYSDFLINCANLKCVFGYIIKPINSQQLEAAIHVAWKRYLEYVGQCNKVDELQEKLENRKYIERAKGILQDRLSIKEAEAMKRLQKMSKDKGKKLAVVAREIIEADELLR